MAKPPEKPMTFQGLPLVIPNCQGNPGVQNLNPYPALHKPLPLVKGRVMVDASHFRQSSRDVTYMIKSGNKMSEIP